MSGVLELVQGLACFSFSESGSHAHDHLSMPSLLYSQQGVNYNDAINCYPCRDGGLITGIGLKDLICSPSLPQSCQHMQDWQIGTGGVFMVE